MATLAIRGFQTNPDHYFATTLTNLRIMAGYTLHGFWRSSCTARLRIILNLKGIRYSAISVDLSEDEQLSAEHKQLNPSASVPLLVHKTAEGSFRIGQSLAAMEYLVDAHPGLGPTLLPPASDLKGRATVKVLAYIIACDNQPVTNVRIMKRVIELGGDAEEWNRGLMRETLAAYEATAAVSAGMYSYGAEVTIADACLAPAVWNARRFKVDMSYFPTINKIMASLEKLEAVKKAHPLSQPDAPAEA